MKIIQKLQNAIIWSCCRVEPSLFYIFSIYPYPSNFLLLFHPTTIFWLMVESRPQGLCNFSTWPQPISISCTFKKFQISIKLELLLQQKSFLFLMPLFHSKVFFLCNSISFSGFNRQSINIHSVIVNTISHYVLVWYLQINFPLYISIYSKKINGFV